MKLCHFRGGDAFWGRLNERESVNEACVVYKGIQTPAVSQVSLLIPCNTRRIIFLIPYLNIIILCKYTLKYDIQVLKYLK